MNVLIFIGLSVVFFNLFFKIYKNNNSMEGLKIALALFILQAISYLGNLMGNFAYFFTPIGSNFTQFSGNLASSITQNFLIIIGLIIVYNKYKKQS